MPAFSPSIRKESLSARGHPWTLWYRQHRLWLRWSILGGLVAAAAIGGFSFYQSQQYIPAAGGVLNEGIIGQPQRLNPLYSSANPVDEELTSLVFRGLLKYDSKHQLIGDLAKNWSKSDDGKTYTVTLGQFRWHDHQPVTADDVAFTVHLTQDPDYHGLWSKSFTDVTVKVESPTKLTFTLKDPYAPFGQNLTIGILPQHLLSGKSAASLASDPFNLQPVGTGILQFESLTLNPKHTAVQEMQFDLTHGYIQAVNFHFYPTLEAAMTDYRLGRLQSLGSTYTSELDSLRSFPAKQEFKQTLEGQSFALYFNQQGGQDTAKKPEARQALAYGLPRDQILDKVFHGYATSLDNVYSSDQPYYSDKGEQYSYDEGKAKDLLSQADINQPKLTLLVADKPLYQQLAKEIAVAWEALDVKVQITSKSSEEVGKMVDAHDGWDVVLLGEKTGVDPDRYSNWHSTQKPPTGLNVSGEDNIRVDKALEDGRKATTEDDRRKAYETFQVYLAKDEPAIWLYQPDYVYIVSNKVHGVKIHNLWDSQDRFANLDQWYLKEERRQ